MFYRPHNRVYAPHDPTVVTKQEFKQECDINNILRQYQRTGIINHVSSLNARYEDMPDDVDFQNSLHIVMQAQASFAELPSKVRAHFSNSPELFLRALNDPSQEQQLREWGILNPRPTVASAAAPPDAAEPAA